MTKFTRPDTVSLVACGPSALKCGAATAPGLVVAINGAFRHVPFAVSLSMDGRFTRNEWKALEGRQKLWRYSAWQHAYRAGARCGDFLDLFGCDTTTTQFGKPDVITGEHQLNGDNSGYCALNFAYVLRPRRVFLYGYDMNEPEHFFGAYPWADEAAKNTEAKFAKWRADMHNAALQFGKAGIDVCNTNPKSGIKAFRHDTP